MDDKGGIGFSLGNPHQLTYPRSALKFFQQIPLVESGAADALGLTEEELAVTCGSHNGEKKHVEAVQSILKKAGLNEAYLQCGPQMPSRHRDRVEFYKADKGPSDIYNNCSGKHAGFLALCRFRNYTVENYLNYDHPVQEEIKSTVAAMHQCDQEQLVAARDGCSAPIYALNIYQQALGYQRLALMAKKAHGRGKACHRILKAVQSNPFMLAGSKRYCTRLLNTAKETVIGKTGAEGVFGLTLPERGIGIAIKIDDGRMGPQYAVAQQLLKELGVRNIQELDEFLEGPLTNLNNWNVGHKGVDKRLFNNLPNLG